MKFREDSICCTVAWVGAFHTQRIRRELLCRSSCLPQCHRNHLPQAQEVARRQQTCIAGVDLKQTSERLTGALSLAQLQASQLGWHACKVAVMYFCCHRCKHPLAGQLEQRLGVGCHVARASLGMCQYFEAGGDGHGWGFLHHFLRGGIGCWQVSFLPFLHAVCKQLSEEALLTSSC